MQTDDIGAIIDPKNLRQVLGCFATGVAVVTTLDADERPIGLVVNSFSSVSLDPPQILWSISMTAPSRPAFQSHAGFAVNIMPAHAKDETMRFCTPQDDKFDGVDWRPGVFGVPVLESALATLECETERRIESGDHEIFIGGVRKIDRTDGLPLVFHAGKFVHLGEAH